MSLPFTPLVSGSPAPAGGAKTSAAFASLGHGHAAANDASTAAPGIDAATGSGLVAGTSPDTPRVTLKREGDRITHVTIHCTCGQVLHLACSY